MSWNLLTPRHLTSDPLAIVTDAGDHRSPTPRITTGAPFAGVADIIASIRAQAAVTGPEARRLEPVRPSPTDASMVHDGTAQPDPGSACPGSSGLEVAALLIATRRAAREPSGPPPRVCVAS